ncbi:MAG: two-component system sensor histidine kinase HydH [Myxococcota bacterium]|jgi:two-component system sensor histidine kinase HydH
MAPRPSEAFARLAQFARLLSDNGLAFQEICVLCGREAIELSGASAVAVFAVGPDGAATCVYDVGLTGPAHAAVHAIDLIDDQIVPRVRTASAGAWAAGRALPLVSARRLFGALTLYWDAPPDEAQVAIAGALADFTGTTLDRHARAEELSTALEELRSSRAELAQSEQLRALGQLAAVVAHEVKNPIASISGALQILQSRFAEGSTDRAIVGKLRARLDELNEMVNDLLVFARPREPKLRLVPLSAVAGDAVALLRNDPQWSGLEVVQDCDDTHAQVDPGMLRQALLNLLLNGAQAQDGQGVLTLRVRGESGRAAIDVVDQGPGVPRKARTQIFEPFFTSKTRGTGLGLSVTLRTVKAHGGTIEIAIPPAGGSVFRIVLPAIA